MILSIKDVTIKNKDNTIIDNVSLSIREGEWFALVGQSGSGKSMITQAIGQLLPSSLKVEGNIYLRDTDLLSLDKKEIRQVRGKRITYIFQNYLGSFTPFHTIEHHFKEYMRVQGLNDTKLQNERMIESLESVALSQHLLKRFPSQLSGGQLQRVSIALALLFSPDIVIADEMTTALDSVSGYKILELLKQRQKETNCTILFITHDWRHVRKYADRLAVMKDGQIIESGGKHRILDHPQHSYTKQLIKAAPLLRKQLPSGLDQEEIL
ncbi:ABC transporter ATP-binding protein [Gracilibacillus oryzae]|uniref:ABC transporter ATP-binding protein n=1 Tax=Gracilibacillus oryzae TaxID=1672701 RepID=A0A7C8GTS7_9BACI|nr:ABC transporter ATP-binding protein [Gracilibacillus oryzae]KAB8137474.1 ABC transporter ATP-binding protein [Gracilibacillus oryzae]